MKTAEDLKAKIVGQGDELNDAPRVQRSGIVRRPIHLTFDDNDDEVIVVGERELEIEELDKQPMRNVRQGESSF